MQALRLLYTVLTLAVAMVFAYIYVKAIIYQYCFWAIAFSGLAFLFLLIGTGKHVVYQQVAEEF